jgi:hypothetical protein
VSDVFSLTVIEAVKVTPLITWADPAPISSGTALGATQLNATASYNGSPVAGVFTYTPPAGTVLALGADQELLVNFAPTNTILYNPASKTVTIDVTEVVKVTPVITWANPAAITVGTALSATQLNATASYNGSPVAGVFTYTPPAGTVLGLGAGQELLVNFVPTNTTLYNSASKTVTIDIIEEATASFYRAINLNGPALLIDGNTFVASTGAPNFSYTTNEKTFVNQNVTLIPSTDANRATMIRSSIYGNTIVLNITSVPSGSYQVWLYVWEDNATQTYSISIEGAVVLANYVSGPAGTWRKLGPYSVNIADGAINVSSSGGHANFSGIEIWTDPQTSGLREAGSARVASFTAETALSSQPLEAYPNPFSKQINVKFQASQSGPARLELFDVRGRRVHLLYEGSMSAGERQEKELESSSLPDGVYILQFVNGKSISRLMLIGVQ